MAFKNAVKMLLGRFGLMWVILLYLLITGVIVVSLGLPFALPALRVFRSAGIGKLLSALYTEVANGASTDVWFDLLYDIMRAMKDALLSDTLAVLSTGALVVFVLIFAYRFVFGLYELPLTEVLSGYMSSNARIGFAGRYIACLGKSCRFVLVKILYTVVFDCVIFAAVYGLFVLLNVPVVKLIAPFLIMIVLLVLLGIRYTLIAMWAPHVTLSESGVFAAFGFSVRRAFRHFGSVFSTFLVAWTLIIAVNMLVGIFTFGAGLILTVPTSILFVHLLNMTVYYGKNGKRYYADATTVITPPAA